MTTERSARERLAIRVLPSAGCAAVIHGWRAHAGSLGRSSPRTALATVLLLACHKAMPPDGVCRYEPLPAGAQVPSGQGGIQVLASTDAYFAVRDTTGKQTASGHVNAIIAVPPGNYQVVLNNSAHSSSAQSNVLTKCTTGAVLVDGKTDEYYAVLDQATRQLASSHVAWSRLFLIPMRSANGEVLVAGDH